MKFLVAMITRARYIVSASEPYMSFIVCDLCMHDHTFLLSVSKGTQPHCRSLLAASVHVTYCLGWMICRSMKIPHYIPDLCNVLRNFLSRVCRPGHNE